MSLIQGQENFANFWIVQVKSFPKIQKVTESYCKKLDIFATGNVNESAEIHETLAQTSGFNP